MEDIVINGYTQVLLAAIGSSLLAALGAVWIILWRVIGEKDSLQKEMRETLINAVTNNTIAMTAFKEALK